MEKKIELIPASELPVAESNEVEMLVVENGELKRKEVDSGVRTVNGIEPDENGNVEVSGGSVPGLAAHYIYVNSPSNNSVSKWSDGIYEALDAVYNDKTPILMTIYMNNINTGLVKVENVEQFSRRDDGTYYGSVFSGYYTWEVHPDGTVDYYYDN